MQIKKALTSILVAGAFLMAGSAAYADYTGSTTIGGVSGVCGNCTAGVTCPDVCPGIGNDTTGPDSINRNTVDIESMHNVVIENTACVNDDMMFDVDTSIGQIASNTVVASAIGGDITGNVVVMHDINRASITMPQMASNIVLPDSLGNSVTGPNSTNINRVRVSDFSNTSIVNDASYSGNYNFDLNTGSNAIANNTSVGNVSTGSVNLGLTENVSLNRGATNIVVPAPSSIVVPDLYNSVTGPGSTNTNTVNINRESNVDIVNSATISNNVNANINTGNNTVENNTCVGNISTGSVRFNVNFTGSAN